MAVDVRVVAATNRDLPAEVKAGRFRADLYYRLAVFPVTVPPLRERRGDVAALVEHFVRHFAVRHGRSVSHVHPATLRTLTAHDWPGNVRELQNLVERAVIVSEGDELAFDPGWLVGATAAETARTWAAQEKQRSSTPFGRPAGGCTARGGGPPARAEPDDPLRQDAQARHQPGRDRLGVTTTLRRHLFKSRHRSRANSRQSRTI